MSYVLLLWWFGGIWFQRDFGIIGATFRTLSPLILAGFFVEYWDSHFMGGMLGDIRYLPKVTQLRSDVEFQPRALSFQNSHCLHYLVGTRETGQTTCKSSFSKAWLLSSPPASNTICRYVDSDRRTPCSTALFIVGNLLSACHQSALNNEWGHSRGLALFSSLNACMHSEGLAGLASPQRCRRRRQQAAGKWPELGGGALSSVPPNSPHPLGYSLSC